MTPLPRGIGIYIGVGLLLGAGLVTLLLVGPRLLTSDPAAPEPADAAAPEPDARRIRARLYYVNDGGTGLVGVEREVLYGEGTVEQAKRIIEAQLARPADSRVSAIPDGTTLRTIFLTDGGDVYLDLSGELQKNHPGGTMNEILTIYALVNALTANLPAITNVQILVEGREVEALAGHLDLRRPIEPDPRWVEQP